MKAILRGPPNWDAHLDEAIAEVNALYPAAMDIVAVRTDPRIAEMDREHAGTPAWVAALAGSACAMFFFLLADWCWRLIEATAAR